MHTAISRKTVSRSSKKKESDFPDFFLEVLEPTQLYFLSSPSDNIVCRVYKVSWTLKYLACPRTDNHIFHAGSSTVREWGSTAICSLPQSAVHIAQPTCQGNMPLEKSVNSHRAYLWGNQRARQGGSFCLCCHAALCSSHLCHAQVLCLPVQHSVNICQIL